MTETAPVAEDGMTETAPVAEDAVDTSEFTITELTSSSASFKTLTAALAAADLSEILSGEGPYTIFAPTDEAFAALPEGAIEQLLLPENKDVLVRILTYHVVPGAVRSSDLETGNVETLEGSDVAVEAGDTVTVNNANVIVPDVEASNGVIHIVDRVILPPAPEASTGVEPSAAAPVQ
ncbi:MAG: fasciclin [Phormidesmis priestleyi]|uniref:Fasciclin n=1 Tax=Phormidesmis priestleyi TaxID=268141 RepID=A0A2W5A2F4_9CYAN|nr:MAG: fasciclin [Phormidesmis priestleyi]